MSELEDKLNSLLSDPCRHGARWCSWPSSSPPLWERLLPSRRLMPSRAPPPLHPTPNPAGFSSLLGSVDPKVIAKFLPMLQSLTADQSHSMQLLNALKPYLKEEKQAKVERAARLARLITVGKRFLLEWEG